MKIIATNQRVWAPDPHNPLHRDLGNAGLFSNFSFWWVFECVFDLAGGADVPGVPSGHYYLGSLILGWRC